MLDINMQGIIEVGSTWLEEHPLLATGALAGSSLVASSRARSALLATAGRAYCLIYPQDQSPIASYTEDTDGPILMGRSSRFARPPKEVRKLAKERGMTYKQLLASALDDCNVSPTNGQIVKCWDFFSIWGDDNLHKDELERWRQRSDGPSDAAMEALEQTAAVKPNEDILQRLGSEQASSPDVASFYKHITARPPPGAGALSQQWYDERRGRHVSPDEELRAEREVLERGQAVFYRNYAGILTALLHFSLAGGFASPRIVRVLEQTGYLVPGKSMQDGEDMSQARADRSWTRLLETTQWVLDVMEGGPETLAPPSESTPEGGHGWRATIRVRMLHTRVRRRILRQADRLAGIYSVERDGVPINQEDLAATLGSFSVAPLLSLQRLGIFPSKQEREDFVATWRHIGYYMGIEPQILQRQFRSATAADQFEISVIRHLFSEMEMEMKQGREPPLSATMPLLRAVAGRKPFFTPVEAHCGIARLLMGPQLATALRVPRTSARMALLLEFTYFTIWYPVWFGSVYPRRAWDVARTSLARPFIRRLIVWSMEEKVSRHFGGQEEENTKVELDQEEGKKLVKQWKGIMREMALVTVGVALVPAVLVAVAFLRLSRA